MRSIDRALLYRTLRAICDEFNSNSKKVYRKANALILPKTTVVLVRFLIDDTLRSAKRASHKHTNTTRKSADYTRYLASWFAKRNTLHTTPYKTEVTGLRKPVNRSKHYSNIESAPSGRRGQDHFPCSNLGRPVRPHFQSAPNTPSLCRRTRLTENILRSLHSSAVTTLCSQNLKYFAVSGSPPIHSACKPNQVWNG